MKSTIGVLFLHCIFFIFQWNFTALIFFLVIFLRILHITNETAITFDSTNLSTALIYFRFEFELSYFWLLLILKSSHFLFSFFTNIEILFVQFIKSVIVLLNFAKFWIFLCEKTLCWFNIWWKCALWRFRVQPILLNIG